MEERERDINSVGCLQTGGLEQNPESALDPEFNPPSFSKWAKALTTEPPARATGGTLIARESNNIFFVINL